MFVMRILRLLQLAKYNFDVIMNSNTPPKTAPMITLIGDETDSLVMVWQCGTGSDQLPKMVQVEFEAPIKEYPSWQEKLTISVVLLVIPFSRAENGLQVLVGACESRS
jgi:hypothetical protein